MNESEFGFIVELPLVFLQKARKDYAGIKELIDEEIATHLKEFDENDQKDAIDMFLAEIKRTKMAGEMIKFNENSFWATIIDVLMAGTETTGTYLSWILLFLAGEPGIKQKVCIIQGGLIRTQHL